MTIGVFASPLYFRVFSLDANYPPSVCIGHQSINQAALGTRHQSAPCPTLSHINTNISAFSSILSDVLHLTPNDTPAYHLFITGATNSEHGELS